MDHIPTSCKLPLLPLVYKTNVRYITNILESLGRRFYKKGLYFFIVLINIVIPPVN